MAIVGWKMPDFARESKENRAHWALREKPRMDLKGFSAFTYCQPRGTVLSVPRRKIFLWK